MQLSLLVVFCYLSSNHYMFRPFWGPSLTS